MDIAELALSLQGTYYDVVYIQVELWHKHVGSHGRHTDKRNGGLEVACTSTAKTDSSTWSLISSDQR